MNHPAEKYNVSENTVSKWKRRDELYDRSSGPHKIYCSHADIEQADIKTVRRSMRLPPDEIEEMARQPNPSASRSAVYRTLLSAGLNKVAEKEREKAKKFKEYEPRYLHVDVTYRPKIDGVKQYLFVAVDRATRTLFYQRYDAKTAENAENFMNRCEEFFPFKITHILTDNGLEFTNAFLVLKKGRRCEKPSKVDEFCPIKNIDHRLTKPNTPKTNSMVEQANGIIESNTIFTEQYATKRRKGYTPDEFLVFYLLWRRHGS